MTWRVTLLALVLGFVAGSWPVPVCPEDSATEPVPLFARKTIADLDLSDTTLEKSFDRLRALTGANLVIRWPAMEAAGVKRDAPVKMRLWDVHPDAALTMLLRYEESGHPAAPLGWQEEDGVVTVSTADDLGGRPRVYDVRDLLQAMTDRPNRVTEGNGPREEALVRAEVEDELAKLIIESVVKDTWRDNGGTIGSIRFIAGRLVVLQSFEGHRQVKRLLQDLRREFVEKDKRPAATSPSPPPTHASPAARQGETSVEPFKPGSPSGGGRR